MIVAFLLGAAAGALMELKFWPMLRRRTGAPYSRGYLRFAISIDVLMIGLNLMPDWRAPHWIGFWVATLAVDLWRWWNLDDDQGKRRREAVHRAKVRFRDFAPSPIPQPAL